MSPSKGFPFVDPLPTDEELAALQEAADPAAPLSGEDLWAVVDRFLYRLYLLLEARYGKD